MTIILLLIGGLWLDMAIVHLKSGTKASSFNISDNQLSLKLKKHIEYLAIDIGERNFFNPDSLDKSADYIQETFENYDYKTVERQKFISYEKIAFNIIATLDGNSKKEENIIIGAHYDSVFGSPGADDNATGVAALLEIARILKDSSPNRTIKFVAFANEEPPYFKSENMGSFNYAKHCNDIGMNIALMISLESLGYYSDDKDSQGYPFPLHFFYPSTANFIAIVGGLSTKTLVKDILTIAKKVNLINVEGVNLPSIIPGVDWSDHWAFWEYDYRAIMVTDTVPYRNPHYHKSSDLPETLNYHYFTNTVLMLVEIIKILADESYKF